MSYNHRGSRRQQHQHPYQHQHQHHRDTSEGRIISLRDSFGFIQCADRTEDVFFHYSEVGPNHEPQIGDEVQFDLAEPRGGRGGIGGGDGQRPKAPKAVNLEFLPPGTIEWDIPVDPEGIRRKGEIVRLPSIDRGRARNGGAIQESNTSLGVVRVVMPGDGEKGGNAESSVYQPMGDKTEVFFASADFVDRRRLGLSDIVEFRLVRNRRNSWLCAKDIILIQSEKERLAMEREGHLLASAKAERGIVLTVKKDHGYLRSVSRTEPIYFHLSHVKSTKNDEHGNAQKTGHDSGTHSFDVRKSFLCDGQCVQFLVVDEEICDSSASSSRAVPVAANAHLRNSKQRRRWSAREVQPLPASKKVHVYETIAESVTGTVVSLPQALGGRDIERLPLRDFDFRGSYGAPGKILLETPLPVGGKEFKFPRVDAEAEAEAEEAEAEDGEVNESDRGEVVIREVDVFPEDSPGGIRIIQQYGGRRQQQHHHQLQQHLGLWLQVGDVVVFDVIRENCHDGVPKVRAHPQQGGAQCIERRMGRGRCLQLVQLSLAGRAEGVISTLKLDAGYGFVRLAERPVDAYFRVDDIMPSYILPELRSCEGDKYPELVVGAEVSFDLSVSQPQQQENKESLKAGRVAIIAAPGSNTVISHKVLATDVKARVTKKHANGSGMLELINSDSEEKENEETEEKQKQGSGRMPMYGMNMDERHPLVARLLDQIENSEGNYGREGVVFPNPLPKHETHVVHNMAEARGLVFDLVQCDAAESGSAQQEKRVVIKIKNCEPASELASGAENPESKCLTRDLGNHDSHEDESKNKLNAECGSRGLSKKKSKKVKPISTSVRFEKNSVVAETSGSEGQRYIPQEGDIVSCDVLQSRSTCQAEAVKVSLLERAKIINSNSGVGIVTELVPARQFGFISSIVIDSQRKQAKYAEKLFFHYDKIVKSTPTPSEEKDFNRGEINGCGSARGSNAEPAEEQSGEQASLSRADGQPIKASDLGEVLIRKGDEVRFGVSTSSKNGKRTAVDIVVLTPGTIPQVPLASSSFGEKNEKNLCQGYVLMEPSHSSLANTPSHRPLGLSKAGAAPPSAGGRWSNVSLGKDCNAADKESTIKEAGCILLLTDPSLSFSSKKSQRMENEGGACKSTSPDKSEASKGIEDVGPCASTPAAKENKNTSTVCVEVQRTRATSPKPAFVSAVGMHVNYRVLSVAPPSRSRGAGGGGCLPRRGDLVSFLKVKGSCDSVKDVRVVQRNAAKLIRGCLEDIDLAVGKACFVVTGSLHRLDFPLSEVVSCDPKILREKQSVEAILHEGSVYGVSRTADLYLETKVGGKRERPRLNLTVRKELQGLGGKIMAQSGMAKGPDGTNGFTIGWTKRHSPYSAVIDTSVQGSGSNDAVENDVGNAEVGTVLEADFVDEVADVDGDDLAVSVS